MVKCRSWLVVARIGWVVLEFVTLDGLGLVEDRRVNVAQLGKDRTSNHADKSGSVSVSDGAFVGGEGFRVLVGAKNNVLSVKNPPLRENSSMGQSSWAFMRIV